MAEGGWLPVNPRTLETKYPSVYAIGDVANTAEGRRLRRGRSAGGRLSLIARIAGRGESHLYGGAGSCYIEFGGERVGRVDVDFFSGPKPTGVYYEPSLAQRADKNAFGATRKARWFGL